MKVVQIYALFLGVLLVLITSCTPVDSAKESSGHSTPARIVCTTGMIGDVVSSIVGDRADVITLLGAGVDPHLYKPTRANVVELSKADLVFYNGLHLEGKMSEVLSGLGAKGKTVVAVAELALEKRPDLVVAEADVVNGEKDPHLWMSVEAWMYVVEVISDTLSAWEPEQSFTYEANALAYLERLRLLHRYASKSLATIPEKQRVLVTAHDAFGYLGEAYGIEVRGIQGLSTESEAGLRDLEDLVENIVERSIPAVFVETSVADKNVRALVEGAASRGSKVEIGGSLFSDAMGATGTYTGTYIGMIDHNVTTITNALGGHAAGFRKQ
ncbi:MAG: metal ABC transporter solute-binding protein, Zn/Mn family [Coraliomargaritaceae bacterium]